MPSHEIGDLERLLPYVSEDKRDEFTAYVDQMCMTEGHDIDRSFLGFMQDYENYASLLKRKARTHNLDLGRFSGSQPKQPPLTVYDVGCASAFQHLLFDPRIHYVGIDMLWDNEPPPRFFRENCSFVQGKFKDVVESLNIHRDTAIGIANMSLFYLASPEECALFDRSFRRKFLL